MDMSHVLELIAIAVLVCSPVYASESYIRHVDSCPLRQKEWIEKGGLFGCIGQLAYHCILSTNQTHYELCILPLNVTDKDGCPQIAFAKQEVLFASSYSTCPPENTECPTRTDKYPTDKLYLYPACLVRVELRYPQRSSTIPNEGDTSSNTVRYRQDYQENTHGGGMHGGYIVAIVSVVLLLVVLAVVSIFLIRRKRDGIFEWWNNLSCIDSQPHPSATKEIEETTPLHPVGSNEAQDISSPESAKFSKRTLTGKKKEEKVKVGALLKLDFPIFGNSTGETLWTKDDQPLENSSRIIISPGTLLVVNVQETDAGKYVCRIEGRSRIWSVTVENSQYIATYHEECIQSLTLIPSILRNTQIAVKHGLNIPRSRKIPKDLPDRLTKLTRETFEVLELTYKSTKEIRMLALKIEQTHLQTILKLLKSSRPFTYVQKEITEMTRVLKKGTDIAQTTLDKVTEVKEKVDWLHQKVTNYCRSKTNLDPNLKESTPKEESLYNYELQNSLAECDTSLKNLFIEWHNYKHFFDSIHFVVAEGLSHTEHHGQENSFVDEDTLTNLGMYVTSIRCSTSCYLEIYTKLLKDYVTAFFREEDVVSRIPENIDNAIQQSYSVMLQTMGGHMQPIEGLLDEEDRENNEQMAITDA